MRVCYALLAALPALLVSTKAAPSVTQNSEPNILPEVNTVPSAHSFSVHGNNGIRGRAMRRMDDTESTNVVDDLVDEDDDEDEEKRSSLNRAHMSELSKKLAQVDDVDDLTLKTIRVEQKPEILSALQVIKNMGWNPQTLKEKLGFSKLNYEDPNYQLAVHFTKYFSKLK
ncbi:hypothetical protein PHYBOEH_006091 [Phytophthora boehmeriae]|uniref:RxLR effector protein n=1 Tax=Phytophthora boehmeriae TaxID=109152 RepID=A0A8T1X4U1_9STRA|nr:hypothetical protein PHYBOEH_006091 [Phytophthora boehmeriae]